jgi:hypothetical protein
LDLIVDGHRQNGTTLTDHLTIGEKFGHFLCSKPLAQLPSFIEGVLGSRLAMTAFVREGQTF